VKPCMGKMKNVYGIFVGTPEKMKYLGRLRPRGEYNINMNLKEQGLRVWR